MASRSPYQLQSMIIYYGISQAKIPPVMIAHYFFDNCLLLLCTFGGEIYCTTARHCSFCFCFLFNCFIVLFISYSFFSLPGKYDILRKVHNNHLVIGNVIRKVRAVQFIAKSIAQDRSIIKTLQTYSAWI